MRKNSQGGVVILVIAKGSDNKDWDKSIHEGEKAT